MPNDKSKGSYETLREKLNLNKADEAETTDSSTQGELELSSQTNSKTSNPTNNTSETSATGSSFELDPLGLEKHKTLTMWEAVDEAKRLVTQSRGMNKESAKLAEETQDIRDEMLEDRKAMAELVKKQGVLLQSQTKMQENHAAIIERQHQVIEQQKTAHNDLLHTFKKLEERMSETEDKVSNRLDLRFADFALGSLISIISYVFFIQYLGPKVVAWVSGLIRG